MPNWVDSTLRVTGPKEELLRFKEAAAFGNDDLSFEALYPMPKELEGTSSPAKIISQEEYDAQELRIKSGNLTPVERTLGVFRGLTQELSDKYQKEYGADNWYDWKNAHYGTKWGICDGTLVEESENQLRYSYQTAWGPAEEGWIKVSKDFPELQFDTFIEEESGSFTGRQDFCNGELEENLLEDSRVPEDFLSIYESIQESTQEEAVRDYQTFLDSIESAREEYWDAPFLNDCEEALKTKMAGGDVEPYVDPFKDLYL